MRIYEGSARQDFEEVFRSIGAFLDQRGMKDVLLLEAPDGFIVQGLVVAGARHELAEFTRDDIEEMVARGPTLRHAEPAQTTPTTAPTSTTK
jgi:hypothetical protein